VIPDRYLSKSASVSLPGRVGSQFASRESAVEQRLARAERVLDIQFTRIAQLQAEVDVLQAVVRRPDGVQRR
jgi:hypothetical protein